MRRFLYRLTNNLPCRIISEGDVPYLERYYVCSFLGTKVHLHRFVGSDPDRGLHSHPWSWAISLVLSGWYFEERFSGTDQPFIRRVRWLNILLGESFHRVVMPADRLRCSAHFPEYDCGAPHCACSKAPTECWTLFIHREQKQGRRWGFLRPFYVGGVVDRDGVQVRSDVQHAFVPFTYPGGKTSSGQWWKSVPKGRDEPRRKPL